MHLIPVQGNIDRRPILDLEDDQGSKKQRMDICEVYDKENFPVPPSLMSLSWNCRRLGNSQIEDELVAMVSNKDPKMVFLMETKIEKPTMERIGRKMQFANTFVVPRLNRGDGLALLWKTNIIVDVQSYSNCHIDVIVDHRVDDA